MMFFKKLKAINEEKVFPLLSNVIIGIWTEDTILSSLSLGSKDARFGKKTKDGEINRKLVMEKLTLALAVVVVEILNETKDTNIVSRFIGYTCSEIEERGLLSLDDELVQLLADETQGYVFKLGKSAITDESVSKIEKQFLREAFGILPKDVDPKLMAILHEELLGFQRFLSFSASRILSAK